MMSLTLSLVVVAASWAESPPRVLEGHTQAISAVAFSFDGKQVASGGVDKEIRVWNVADGKLLRTLTGLSQSAQVLAFSPGGEYLAAGDAGLELKLWDLRKNEAPKAWMHQEAISALAFSADGKRLYVGGMGGNGAAYTVPEAKATALLARSLQVFSDGTLLVGRRDGQIALDSARKGGAAWKIFKTGTHVPMVVGAAGSAEVLSWNPSENDIFVWSPVAKKESGRLVGHQRGLTSLALSADGAHAVSSSLDGTVRLWDVKARKELAVIRAQGALFAAVSPDFSTLAVGEGRYLKLWKLPK